MLIGGGGGSARKLGLLLSHLSPNLARAYPSGLGTLAKIPRMMTCLCRQLHDLCLPYSCRLERSTTTFTCGWVRVSVQFHHYQFHSSERRVTNYVTFTFACFVPQELKMQSCVAVWQAPCLDLVSNPALSKEFHPSGSNPPTSFILPVRVAWDFILFSGCPLQPTATRGPTSRLFSKFFLLDGLQVYFG